MAEWYTYLAFTYAAMMIFTAYIAPRLNKIQTFTASAITYAVIIDIIPGHIGLWTLYTPIAWALVATWFSTHNKSNSLLQLSKLSLTGVLLFDFTTALLFGLQYQQTLTQTIIGQIPFTLSHILTVGLGIGTIAVATILVKQIQKQKTKQTTTTKA